MSLTCRMLIYCCLKILITVKMSSAKLFFQFGNQQCTEINWNMLNNVYWCSRRLYWKIKMMYKKKKSVFFCFIPQKYKKTPLAQKIKFNRTENCLMKSSKSGNCIAIPFWILCAAVWSLLFLQRRSLFVYFFHYSEQSIFQKFWGGVGCLNHLIWLRPWQKRSNY